MGHFEKRLKSMKITITSKKIVVFKMSQGIQMTMINKKTQLDYVVSLVKGLGYYFHAEDEKSIFDFKNSYFKQCSVVFEVRKRCARIVRIFWVLVYAT